MGSPADRGKKAEAALEKRLDMICAVKGRYYYRLPDARAGSLTPTLADYLYFENGQTTVIEVKEVAHDFRLPHKNFKPENVARIKMLAWAGVKTLVLINSTTLGLWRGYTDIEKFVVREGGSWDLRDRVPMKLEELL